MAKLEDADNGFISGTKKVCTVLITHGRRCNDPRLCQSLQEIHPENFAWSRSSTPFLPPPPPAQKENVIVSSAMRAAADLEGNGGISEYAASYRPITAEPLAKTAKAEKQLQMGLFPEHMDAAKWTSEYDGSYVELGKNPEPEAQPESVAALKMRKVGAELE